MTSGGVRLRISGSRGMELKFAMAMHTKLFKLFLDPVSGYGASLKTYQGRTCWLHKDIKHALVAEELANWLNKRYLANWPEPINIAGANWATKASGKTGVIFFKDYWLRKGEKTPTGDHIDLWDKDSLVSGGLTGFARFTLGISSVNLSYLNDDWNYSDLDKSTQILLWEIK
jgi:hypothetical protein